MASISNSHSIQVGVSDLMAYLNYTGWSHTEQTDRWHVFTKVFGEDNEFPLEIVLPQKTDASDVYTYISIAIDLLAELNEESLSFAADRVRYYDRDVLKIHNTEVGEYNSVPLNIASQQISHLRRLVYWSAASERNPKPAFLYQSPIGRQMAKQFRFGHTFPGSFGYTIESHIGLTREFSRIVQPPLDEELTDPVPLVEPPIERRVMERVVRGLATTKTATQMRDLNILVKGYEGGLNANMCTALVKIADEQMPIEYSILWSPKIPPTGDVSTPGVLRISAMEYTYLVEAAEALRSIQPELVEIIGRVQELSSTGDPLSLRSSRSVIIKWTHRSQGYPIKVLVELERGDYKQAIRAHEEWSTVKIIGYLNKVGNLYRLSDPSRFEVVYE